MPLSEAFSLLEVHDACFLVGHLDLELVELAETAPVRKHYRLVCRTAKQLRALDHKHLAVRERVLRQVQVQLVACKYSPSIFKIASVSQEQGRATKSLRHRQQAFHKVVCDCVL